MSPVDGWRREFCAYSALPRNCFQEFWWPWQKVCRKHLISWIFLSVCPLVCGWYPEERLTVTSRREKNAFQTREINWGPRSDTMSSGIPKYRNTWLNRVSAVSMAVGRPLRGRRRQLLENLSIMTRIHVLPSEGGRSVMKSTPRCDQGRFGTGSGRSLPDGRWRGLLEMAQSGHPYTNLRTSRAMLGHQK